MAQKRAYEIADSIHFDGCQMRRDIGYRAIGQEIIPLPLPRYALPLSRKREKGNPLGESWDLIQGRGADFSQ